MIIIIIIIIIIISKLILIMKIIQKINKRKRERRRDLQTLRVSISNLKALQSPTEAQTKANSGVLPTSVCNSKVIPAKTVVLPISSSGKLLSHILRCASLNDRRR